MIAWITPRFLLFQRHINRSLHHQYHSIFLSSFGPVRRSTMRRPLACWTQHISCLRPPALVSLLPSGLHGQLGCYLVVVLFFHHVVGESPLFEANFWRKVHELQLAYDQLENVLGLVSAEELGIFGDAWLERREFAVYHCFVLGFFRTTQIYYFSYNNLAFFRLILLFNIVHSFGLVLCFLLQLFLFVN